MLRHRSVAPAAWVPGGDLRVTAAISTHRSAATTIGKTVSKSNAATLLHDQAPPRRSRPRCSKQTPRAILGWRDHSTAGSCSTLVASRFVQSRLDRSTNEAETWSADPDTSLPVGWAASKGMVRLLRTGRALTRRPADYGVGRVRPAGAQCGGCGGLCRCGYQGVHCKLSGLMA